MFPMRAPAGVLRRAPFETPRLWEELSHYLASNFSAAVCSRMDVNVSERVRDGGDLRGREQECSRKAARRAESATVQGAEVHQDAGRFGSWSWAVNVRCPRRGGEADVGEVQAELVPGEQEGAAASARGVDRGRAF